MRQLAFLIALAIAVLLSDGCAARTREARIRGALNMGAVPVDAAYSFAMDACIAREEQIATAAEAGTATADEARAQLVPVRDRCGRTRAGFELLRSVHEQAVAFIESGAVEKAEAALAALRAQWEAFTLEGKVTDGRAQ